MGKAVRFGLAGLMAATLFGAAPQAFASHGSGGGGGITTEGACSATSDWKLKVSPENNRLEVEFEVDSNVVGQTWKVRLSDNGVRFFQGTAVTQDPSGSFEVRKLTADQAGTDNILAQAKNMATGETCKGTASL
jgi:hypothetical protein